MTCDLCGSEMVANTPRLVPAREMDERGIANIAMTETKYTCPCSSEFYIWRRDEKIN